MKGFYPELGVLPVGVVVASRLRRHASGHLSHMPPSERALPYAGVVFDVDGTLVDTNYLHALCWWQAFSQFGHVVPMAQLHRAIGMGADRLVPHVLGREHPPKETADVTAAHGILFATWWELVQPLPGAESLLRWCWKQQLTTLVASSSRSRELEAMLDVLGRPDLDVMVSGDDVDEAKPNPDLLSVALERADLQPQDAVLVGDSVWDVQAATAAGLPCIGLTCGGTSADELGAAGAIETYADPEGLLDHWRHGAWDS
jgi:HAD superfamily hydrolase (TIGR01509 family)